MPQGASRQCEYPDVILASCVFDQLMCGMLGMEDFEISRCRVDPRDASAHAGEVARRQRIGRKFVSEAGHLNEPHRHPERAGKVGSCTKHRLAAPGTVQPDSITRPVGALLTARPISTTGTCAWRTSSSLTLSRRSSPTADRLCEPMHHSSLSPSRNSVVSDHVEQVGPPPRCGSWSGWRCSRAAVSMIGSA